MRFDHVLEKGNINTCYYYYYYIGYLLETKDEKRENKMTPQGNSKVRGAPQEILCTKSMGKS